jgi:hypothetical protein
VAAGLNATLTFLTSKSAADAYDTIASRIMLHGPTQQLLYVFPVTLSGP